MSKFFKMYSLSDAFTIWQNTNISLPVLYIYLRLNRIPAFITHTAIVIIYPLLSEIILTMQCILCGVICLGVKGAVGHFDANAVHYTLLGQRGSLFIPHTRARRLYLINKYTQQQQRVA